MKSNNLEPNFTFGITALPNSSDHFLQLFCTIPEMEGVLRGFVEYFNTLEQIAKAEKALASPSLHNHGLGANDQSVFISGDFVEFDYYFKDSMPFKEHYPLKLTINQFRNFLNAAKDTLQKYESCQIPGLLPNSKFDTWSIVNNNNVDQSYFNERKSRIHLLLDKIGYNEKDRMFNLMVKAPLLEQDLNSMLKSEIPNTSIGRLAIVRSMKEFLEWERYSGYELKGRVYTNLIRIKIEQLKLPESFIYYASEQLGHKGFTVNELESIFGGWAEQLNNREGIEAIAKEISNDKYFIDKYYHFIERYPTVLFETKAILTGFKSLYSRSILKNIISSKFNSKSSNESILGFFYRDLIKAKMIELNISEEFYDVIRAKTYDEISEEQLINAMIALEK